MEGEVENTHSSEWQLPPYSPCHFHHPSSHQISISGGEQPYQISAWYFSHSSSLSPPVPVQLVLASASLATAWTDVWSTNPWHVSGVLEHLIAFPFSFSWNALEQAIWKLRIGWLLKVFREFKASFYLRTHAWARTIFFTCSSYILERNSMW